METHILTLTFQECSARYGLEPAVLHEFLQAGLLRVAPAPGSWKRYCKAPGQWKNCSASAQPARPVW